MESVKNTRKKSGIIGKIFVGILFSALIIYAVSMIMLLLWGLMTSMKSRRDFNTNALGFPKWSQSKNNIIKLENYKLIFSKFKISSSEAFYSGDRQIVHNAEDNFFSMLLNSLLYAGVGAIIQAIVPAVVAYTCVKYKFRFSKLVYAVTLFAYIVPIVGNYPSVITVLRNIGIYDTIWGNWIQKFNFSGMYFFVFWAFFEGFSDTYAEAAEIDGASQLRILFSVVLPLTAKMISSVALVLFVQYWNDYQTPLLYLPTHPTLSYGVYYMTQINHSDRDLANTPTKIAGCMLLAIPVLLIFIALKDKIMGNMSMGGIKE